MLRQIPLAATVHFQCAFDITSPAVPNLTGHVRRVLRRWCEAKAKAGPDDRGHLHRPWFFLGNKAKYGDPPQYQLNGLWVRAESAPGDRPDEPSCWAVEVIHQDAGERIRWWSTEVTVRPTDGGRVRLAAVVKHWLFPGYIGPYPPPPAPSAPRFVRHLLADPDLTCARGDAVLRPEPVPVTTATCQQVYDRLASPDRQVPFVLCGYDARGPVDPAALAAALAGTANVFPLAGDAARDEMNYYLGRDDLRCGPGAVRVYVPWHGRADPGDADRHRYLSPRFMADHGPDAVLGMLADGLARNGLAFRRDDLTAFGDVYTHRRRHAIRKLATQTQAAAAERSLAWEDNQRLGRDAGLWEAEALRADAENADLKRELADARGRVDEAERVRHLVADLRAQVAGLHRLTALPTTLPQVLAAVAGLFPDRLAVTPEAARAADAYADAHPGHWAKAENLSVAWGMVFGLATTLYDLVFVRNVGSPEEHFRTPDNPFDVTMSEGTMTNRDAGLRALRRRTFDGRGYDISPHVKYGSEPPRLLRLHFAVCRDTRRLIVGHFGGHLDTAGTRRRS